LTRALAVFGTASDVGKSITATALCKIFARKGIKVAPFKAQNMSNNAFVTIDGLEIGVAQAVQSIACKETPNTDMNPVLLKPQSRTGSQVILNGKSIGSIKAKEYFENTDYLYQEAMKSLNRLKSRYELIVIEGAGSCAEVNLKGRDFANFKTAHSANADAILVADIDKGGVFAQIIGTLECLEKRDRALIKGIIINKFRGDDKLFQEGIKYIEEKTNIPVLGLVPYFKDIEIDYEDSLSVDFLCDKSYPLEKKVNIAVIRLPYISNFTDFLPFKLESSVFVHYVSKLQALDGYDAVVIPGSKSSISDLEWLKKTGWKDAIRNYAEKGGFVVGVCGGFQILGKKIYDPYGIESNKTEVDGLGILDVETILEKNKTLSNSRGIWLESGIYVSGYEIHMGKTQVSGKNAIKVEKRNGAQVKDFDGIVSENVWGVYFHGIFDNYNFRHYFLNKVAGNKFKKPNRINYSDFQEMQMERLANHFKRHIDIKKLFEIVGFDV